MPDTREEIDVGASGISRNPPDQAGRVAEHDHDHAVARRSRMDALIDDQPARTAPRERRTPRHDAARA
jgi:hypothetical protein